MHQFDGAEQLRKEKKIIIKGSTTYSHKFEFGYALGRSTLERQNSIPFRFENLLLFPLYIPIHQPTPHHLANSFGIPNTRKVSLEVQQ